MRAVIGEGICVYVAGMGGVMCVCSRYGCSHVCMQQEQVWSFMYSGGPGEGICVYAVGVREYVWLKEELGS